MPIVRLCEDALVLHKHHYNAQYYKLTLRAPRIARLARPGQFVHLRVPHSDACFLRRPLSLANTNPQAGTVDIIAKVLGQGTRQLADVDTGVALDLLGPLGKAWPVLQAGQSVAMVGGGVGFPPLFFYAQQLHPACRVTFYYGGRSADDILEEADLARCSVRVAIATEDGSKGVRGRVTLPFEQGLLQDRPDVVLTCGPTAMMRAVAELCQARQVTCYASLEERMGCGLGVCIGCVVRTSRGFERVCTEGPVFNVQDVWEWAHA